MQSRKSTGSSHMKTNVASQPGQFERLSVGKGIRVISFFTGAGGLDLGFDLSGYDVVYATDIDRASCDSLLANVGGML